MDLFKQLVVFILSVVVFTGCVSKYNSNENNTTKTTSEIKYQQLLEQLTKNKIEAAPPSLILPSVYEKPTIENSQKKITYSATNAPLSKLLYLIAADSGLNLVVDSDIDVDKRVTLNMVDAPIKDALEIIMNISNTYVEIKGNILHVKNIMTRTFELPFINMSPTTVSNIGGDLVGSNEQTQGIAGEYTLGYKSDEDKSDFYKQLEESIKPLLSEDAKYSLNKYSGTLVVSDYRNNVEKIEDIVENLKKFVSKQVSIDAKIMEVILNESNQFGIDWQKSLNGNNKAFSVGQVLGTTTEILGGITMKYTTDNFAGVLQAMQISGTVNVVSNPKLKVLNGHSGILSSGNMIPYWNKEVTKTATTNPTTGVVTYSDPTTTYEKTDVLNGISLGVAPIIKENGDVILNIVPVISNIEGEKILNDLSGEVARAPIINLKEAGTTVKARDNDMIVIGGLISTTEKDYEYKTPFLGDIPGLGYLFKRIDKKLEKRELVIILKINIDESNR